MTDRPLRRVAIVVAIYLVVALVVLPVSEWARRIFALPGLFSDLLRLGLLAGLPVAAVLAWHYPKLGHGDGPATGGSPPEG